MMQKKDKTKPITLHPRRSMTHGGYSYLTRGELPEGRDYIEKYLTGARMGLISDLGPIESDLTTAQLILIDRVIAKLGCLRCIEEFARVDGVIKGNRLAPPLAGNYLAYSNSIRLDLTALGINKRVSAEALDVQEYIKQFDAEKEANRQNEQPADRQKEQKDDPAIAQKDDSAIIQSEQDAAEGNNEDKGELGF